MTIAIVAPLSSNTRAVAITGNAGVDGITNIAGDGGASGNGIAGGVGGRNIAPVRGGTSGASDTSPPPTITNSGTIIGGNGGNFSPVGSGAVSGGGGAGIGGGGNGGVGNTNTGGGGGGAGIGGGGGGGGSGNGMGTGMGGNITVPGTGLSIINDAGALIQGGQGGTGAIGGSGIGAGGGQASGIQGPVTITNNGTIQGGAGGGTGNGGAGISGSNIQIVNSAAISGGLNGSGTLRANAVTFTGGTNSLELHAGSVITGNVAANAADTLLLGGTTDASFDTSLIGPAAQYRGFGQFAKTGTSTWTLTGTTTAVTPWRIDQGVLTVAQDGSLGDASGTLTFNGGTLNTTASFSMTRAITITASGGTIDTGGMTLIAAGPISGSGALTKVGTGTLTLTGTNAYTGGTTITAGILQLGNGGTTGSIVGDVVNDGTLAFDRSDVYIFTGLISGTGAVNQNGSGTLVLTADNTYSGGTTITAGTLQLGDGGTTGSIVGDIVDNGTLAFNHSDTFTVSGVISGTGGVDQIGSGTTVLTAANSYSGPTNIQTGTLQAGAANTFSPNSPVAVASGATLDLAGFNQTIPGLTNAGTLNMGTGTAPGTALTISGNYVGQGGTIILNTYLGNETSASDKLVIGGTATGATALDIRNSGGPGAQTNGNGILVVQALPGASTSGASFTLAHRVAAGAYEYHLVSNPNQNWYLQTPPPPEAPQGAKEPRPEISTNSVVPSLALQFGYAMLGNADDRGGLSDKAGSGYDAGAVYDERSVWCKGKNPHDQNVTFAPSDRNKCIVRVPVVKDSVRWVHSGWAQVIGERRVSDQDNYVRRGPDYDYTVAGIKAGLDIYARQQADGTLDKAGVYVGYGRVSSNVYGLPGATYGHKAGSVDMDGYTLGGYWTHFSPHGWYTDAVVQGTWYTNTNAKSVLNENISPDGFGILGSLEGGYQFKFGSGWMLTPQAQIVYQNVTFDRARDSFGMYRFQNADSLRARLGVRLAKTWNTADTAQPRLIMAFLRANVWHEFLGNTKTSVIGFNGENPLTTPSSLKGTWGEIGAGVTAQISDKVSLFANVNYQRSLDNKGVQAWDGKLGLTAKW